MTDPAPNLDATIAELERLVEGLADQQAMADDGWRPRLSHLIAALRSRSVVEGERERIAAALDYEADVTPCHEDAVVVRDCARLVRADFSYDEAERIADSPTGAENARVPAPPALGREEIARGIDPEAWEEIDGHRAAVDSFSGASRLPALSAHFVDQHKGEIERLGQPSLAKADAILSAQRVPAGDGGGEQSCRQDTPVQSEARSPEGSEPSAGWRDISEAKKDGTIIWAALRPDIYPTLKPGRDDLECWNGVQVPLRHHGVAADGFDVGWNIAARVGAGGFPDEWIAGWMPLPATADLSGGLAHYGENRNEHNTLQGSGGKGEGV